MKFDRLYEQLVGELFDQRAKVDWKIDPKNNKSFEASFNTKPDRTGKDYIVTVQKGLEVSKYLEYLQNDYEESDIEELFEKDIPAEFRKFAAKKPDTSMWGVTFEDKELSLKRGEKSSFGLTGAGDSVTVFSNVVNILKDFIAKYDPKILYFSASEPSRIKLYDRMLERLASALGYKYFKYTDNYRKGKYICYKP